MPPKKNAQAKERARKFAHLSAREETFHERVQLGKAKKIVEWPIHKLNTSILANYGFHYQPTLQKPDQIQCFYCLKKFHSLDNMDEIEVGALDNCEYSKLVRFSKNEHTDVDLDDPSNPVAYKRRLATFTLYPHASPTAEALAEAGFIFTPHSEFDDSTLCIYCACVLNDWDKDDDPLEEHRARNEECAIFTANSNSKTTDDNDQNSSIQELELDKDDTNNSIQIVTQKAANRYGASKIKKNKIVTSSSNQNSTAIDESSQQLPLTTSQQRRSWYRDSPRKRSSSDAFSEKEEKHGISSPKKSKEDDEDFSLMEISAIQEGSALQKTAINGESLENIIESTFAASSRPSSAHSKVAPSSPLASKPLMTLPKKAQHISAPPKRLPARRGVSRSSRMSSNEEGVVRSHELLDAISSDKASSHVSQSIVTDFTEEVFDHHNVTAQSVGDKGELGPSQEPDLDVDSEVHYKAELSVESENPVETETAEHHVAERASSVPDYSVHTVEDTEMEIPIQTQSQTLSTQNKAGINNDEVVTKETANLDEASIAKIIEEENRTIYSDRRRTRSSMLPFSPSKPTSQENDEKDESEFADHKSKSVRAKAGATAKTKAAAKQAKKRNGNVIRKNGPSSRSPSAEHDSQSSKPSNAKTSKAQSSGDLIGSPESTNYQLNKRQSLQKMMLDRNSRLAEVDETKATKLPSKLRLRRESSFFMNKSPGKSPLKLNKLIDANENDDDDIFSQSSPVRQIHKFGKSKAASYGIDKITAELGKDIFGDHEDSARNSKSSSPKLEKQEAPLLAPPTQSIFTELSSPAIAQSTSPARPNTEVLLFSNKRSSVAPLEPTDEEVDDADDDGSIPESKLTTTVKVISTKSSRESLRDRASTAPSPSQSPPASQHSQSFRRTSSRPSLRLSILPAADPEKPAAKSPIQYSKFEISHLDDDVILADDDMKSGDISNRQPGNDSKNGHEESTKHDECRVPGAIAEFMEQSKDESIAAPEVVEANTQHDTPTALSIQHLDLLKSSSTPLNAQHMKAESTPLDNGALENASENSSHLAGADKANVEKKADLKDLGVLIDNGVDKDNIEGSTVAEKSTDQVVEEAIHWDPAETTVLDEIIKEIESSGEYLTKMTNSPYDSLSEDLDGELTNFIAHMPDEELEMTVKEWIMHNSRKASQLLDMNLKQMVDTLKKEGDRALRLLENLPIKEEENGVGADASRP